MAEDRKAPWCWVFFTSPIRSKAKTAASFSLVRVPHRIWLSYDPKSTTTLSSEWTISTAIFGVMLTIFISRTLIISQISSKSIFSSIVYDTSESIYWLRIEGRQLHPGWRAGHIRNNFVFTLVSPHTSCTTSHDLLLW